MSAPLIAEGIRIVDVSDYVFVPIGTATLANWGADVIKVEHHERGDAIRGARIHEAKELDPSAVNSMVFELVNGGKRSIGLNLSSEAGRNVLYELVKQADVFVTNRTGAVVEKLGIGLEEIRAHNPDIIYAHGTAHGTRGPEVAWGGFDVSDFWYRSGIAAATHVPDAELPPWLPSSGFGDVITGFYLASGIVNAIYHRGRTGEAVTVEASLLGSGMWAMGFAITNSSLSGQPYIQKPHGRAPNPLMDIYRTADGQLVYMSTMQGFRYLAEFCDLLGLTQVAKDPRYASHAKFEENATELSELITKTIGAMTLAEVVERMSSYSGQWSPVKNSHSVASDVQAIANGYVTDIKTPAGEPMKAIVPPVQFNGASAEFRPAPRFNEHGEEILKELGMSDEQILDLKIAGAVT